MRLDQWLARTHFSTRSKAQDAIGEGRVRVNGKVVLKNSLEIGESDVVEIAGKEHEFVSRAGKKLFDVLDAFGIDLNDRCVLDVGASTGGFSDVCLKRGARLVYALDVGHDQLHASLRNDPRCINMEGHNIRDLRAEWFSTPVDFICMDISFLSCITALRQLHTLFAEVETLVLVKPQFEAGPAYLNKHGVIREDNVLIRVLQEVVAQAQSMGYCVRHLRQSTLTGRDGNREFLMHLTDDARTMTHDIRAIVKGGARDSVQK